jgi:allantoicase
LTEATDLAARWLGGTVLAASDESFGDKENLLNPGPAYRPGIMGNRGEVVDGWETRRLRQPGYDWAVVRLGVAGTITSIEVDTSFFAGNFPESCRIEACGREGYPGTKDLDDDIGWYEIVPRSPLQGDCKNVFPVVDRRRFTHVRMSIFPDGGVARLRVIGDVVPDPRQYDGVTTDLVSQAVGGTLVASSDNFYTSASMLNRPDEPRTMGDGWETRRRRDSGNDFAIFAFGIEGAIRKIVVDTTYFRYNATPEITLQRCSEWPDPSVGAGEWEPLLARTSLQPDTSHVFMVSNVAVTAGVRLDAFPDGGISRLRLIGQVDPAARRRAGYQWFNSLPEDQAVRCLETASLTGDVVAGVVAARPLPEEWLDSEASAIAWPSKSSAAEGLRTLAALLVGPAERGQ